MSPLEVLIASAAPANLAALGHAYFTGALRRGGAPVDTPEMGMAPSNAGPDPVYRDRLYQWLSSVMSSPSSAY
jgi:hypothetical protein